MHFAKIILNLQNIKLADLEPTQNQPPVNNDAACQLQQSKVVLRFLLVPYKQLSKHVMPRIGPLYDPPPPSFVSLLLPFLLVSVADVRHVPPFEDL